MTNENSTDEQTKPRMNVLDPSEKSSHTGIGEHPNSSIVDRAIEKADKVIEEAKSTADQAKK